ncbi:MAG: ABC transporter permease [Pseudomonadota bacterium]
MGGVIGDIAIAAPPVIMMALGLFVMFRVMGELDLSVDATYTNGAAITALSVLSGASPWLGLLAATLFGALIGSIVFVIHRLGRTAFLLASLIVLTGLYSINLRVLGGATVGLIGEPSIFAIFGERPGDLARAGLLCLVVLGVLSALYAFLHTAFGLSMRAAGNNAVMARANGTDTRATLLVGAMMAGALYGLGGGLQVQIQGYADITMGIGAVVICVAALFLGELFFPPEGRIAAGLAAVVLGGALYVTILTLALRSGLPPTDLRLATASILAFAVMISSGQVRGRLRAGIAAVLATRSRDRAGNAAK